MEISERIKKIRKDNNLNQNDFAESLEVSRQTISSWESGKSVPQTDMVKVICDKYNIDVNELLRSEVLERPKREVRSETNDAIVFTEKSFFKEHKTLKIKLKILLVFLILVAIIIPLLYINGIFPIICFALIPLYYLVVRIAVKKIIYRCLDNQDSLSVLNNLTYKIDDNILYVYRYGNEKIVLPLENIVGVELYVDNKFVPGMIPDIYSGLFIGIVIKTKDNMSRIYLNSSLESYKKENLLIFKTNSNHVNNFIMELKMKINALD